MHLSSYLSDKNHWDTIIVGGGQAGLATGYFLKQLKQEFIILDESEKTGDSWRNRWDSLRAFTPGWTNGLPGMPFPGPKNAFPSKDEIAGFLVKYKETFDLPVIYCSSVSEMVKSDSFFELIAGDKKYFAKTVVVATGNFALPKMPAFSAELNPGIRQLHSSTYLSPAAIPDGDVLIVGAGISGLQIALDLASGNRTVYVAGKPPAKIPDFIFKYLEHQFVWFARNILNTRTPIGRKARHAILSKGKGAPLIKISLEEVIKKGVIHLGRIAGVHKGWPITVDGKEIHINTTIWCTGFLPKYSWIKLKGILDSDGYPLTNRGVSSVIEGLFFAGSMFQYSLTSVWIGGVGRDAEFIAGKITDYNKRNQPIKAVIPDTGLYPKLSR